MKLAALVVAGTLAGPASMDVIEQRSLSADALTSR